MTPYLLEHRITNSVVSFAVNAFEKYSVILGYNINYFKPLLYDQKCTEMYMEILMTHNIKNYEA